MTEDTETEQEDIYIVNKLPDGQDVNRTAPLPAQKVTVNSLFADGLADIRNDLRDVEDRVESAYFTFVNKAVRAEQAARYIFWLLFGYGLALLAIAVMLGYIIGRVR